MNKLAKIALTEKEIVFIKAILKEVLPNAKAYLFGSRAFGNPRTFSDIDIAIDNKIALTLRERTTLESAFEESSLNYRVDCVDLNAIDQAFKEKIERNMSLL